jgi:selenide,water dikinase
VQAGDHLVLCKPLGTGVLFAARQQGKADGRWIHRAIDGMLRSNAAAAQLGREHAVHAATDITGFGLLGHLAEMLQGGLHGARIELSRVPCLPGVAECFAAGVTSTLQPGNIAAASPLVDVQPGVAGYRLQALFDPQTCGGLLLSVAASRSAGLLAALHAAGFAEAAVVGDVLPGDAGEPLAIRVVA